MLDAVLRYFPAHTHPLTLVSDPDGLLAEEAVLAALAERGFTLLNEPDPVRLRWRVEQLRPFTVDRPVVIVTAGPLNALPYDLWQQGHHVTLALHEFFPDLAYPVVQTLTPNQRWRLSLAPAPPKRLGTKGTIAFLLEHVFSVPPNIAEQPARLVEWLNAYHQAADRMPATLEDALLTQLRSSPHYVNWPLDTLLADREAFATFVREQWSAFMGQHTGQPIGEPPAHYLLRFGEDTDLQDMVSSLVRSGALVPVQVWETERLPPWSRAAVVAEGEDRVPRRAGELLATLSEYVPTRLSERRWEQWQTIARAWAELDTLRHGRAGELSLDQASACAETEKRLHEAFPVWLQSRYAPLGAQRLPSPHHVHHVPHYIAYVRRQGGVERVALLVMDGMSLADWHLIGQVWRARHPDWRIEERLLLAQIPTIHDGIPPGPHQRATPSGLRRHPGRQPRRAPIVGRILGAGGPAARSLPIRATEVGV